MTRKSRVGACVCNDLGISHSKDIQEHIKCSQNLAKQVSIKKNSTLILKEQGKAVNYRAGLNISSYKKSNVELESSEEKYHDRK